ncbi:hypothetical protein [Noviherbaspirillum sp.]|uniref:hypothetical protein n=1 Tax=Noviherbaspirillum sp. TaxID=1926288 RepID=UPI002FE2B78B
MAGPRTTREALMVELLGDVDALLARVEQLPHAVMKAESALRATVTALEDAGDQYRIAVTAFNEQAKAELTQHLDRKAAEVTSKTVDEQRAALQSAARAAFASATADNAAQLRISPDRVANHYQRTSKLRWIEHGMTALLASLLTAAMMHLLN